MAIPELELKHLRGLLGAYCETKIPERVRDQVRLGYRVDGHIVFLTESRPPWTGGGDWTSIDVARFRSYASRQEWVLYWARARGKWMRYDGVPEWSPFERLLKEVDDDPWWS